MEAQFRTRERWPVAFCESWTKLDLKPTDEALDTALRLANGWLALRSGG